MQHITPNDDHLQKKLEEAAQWIIGKLPSQFDEDHLYQLINEADEALSLGLSGFAADCLFCLVSRMLTNTKFSD